MGSVGLGHIRYRYGVPAYSRRRVKHEGRSGTIRRSVGCFLQVEFDDAPGVRSRPIHPLDIDWSAETSEASVAEAVR